MPAFKMFDKIIRQVFLPWVPLDVETPQFSLVGDPEESHFHRSRPLFLDGVIRDACGRFVIAVDGRRRLRVAHFLEY